MQRGSGFTLVEALAAVTLIGVGIVATMQCLTAVGHSRGRALEGEEMQRLAFRKYDELLALGGLPSGRAEGGFEEIGERRFTWRANRSATGIAKLDELQVDVMRRGEGDRPGARITGLVASAGGGQ